jgi:signal transduction histidine kinase
MFDPRSLMHVVHNLVNNAVKFTPRGGMVKVSARVGPQGTDVEVRDTGIGIKPEDREHLFEEFRQLDGSTARLYEGVGIGLALSKRLIEMQGGQIWADSEPGKGSVFSFLIPAKPLGVVSPPQTSAELTWSRMA